MTITLSADHVRASIDEGAGGRVSSLVLDGTELLIARDTVVESDRPLGWGSYPMVPWAGRVRHGRFVFRGAHVDLPRNLGAHATHGVGFTSPWRLVAQDPVSAELELTLPSDARWPFGGVVMQRIHVEPGAITLAMSVRAAGRAFPAEIGWHPWFRKPDAVDFHPTAMYRRDEHGITLGELVDVPDGPWDDCFLNTEPVVVEIDRTRIRLTSDCDHWVVYDERPWATCIEPQTGPPDAFNLGAHVVEPGSELSAWYRIELADLPPLPVGNVPPVA